ncbi:hypothetical protein CVT25_007778 [Psilocybe cyanescens]|uniref:Uncharacterized protein n=1 Tax=Psilocybe cyanescens TaxID=93625 RepID=A0A409XHZ9_PSICY|nr:hypothetical protein CVT25_007778 [Psilocybe cyanescens]
MGQEPPAFPSPASAMPTPAYTTEKPGQVHYNSRPYLESQLFYFSSYLYLFSTDNSNAPNMPNAQAYYPQQLQQYQNEYRPQQGSYQQSQPQAHAQPQVIYVQQQSKPDNSDSFCLPCAWLFSRYILLPVLLLLLGCSRALTSWMGIASYQAQVFDIEFRLLSYLLA